MNIIRNTLAAVLLAATTSLPAQESNTVPRESLLHAGTAATIARNSNPELAAARSLIAEAEARAGVAGRLANPELSTEVAGGQESEGRVAVGITQRFPLTGRLRFERELSAIELEMARMEVKERERQIEVAARSAFYDLAAARASLALARRHTASADAFAKSIGEGVAQGFGSNLDAQQAQLAADILRACEESLHSDAVSAVARLNELLGRQAEATLQTSDSLDLPESVPPTRPVGTRPDLQLAELAVQAGAAEVSLAKAGRWEDVGVGVFFEGDRFRDEPEGIEPEALIGLQFSVPLPLWQNGAGKVAEREAAQTRKTQMMEALRLKVRNELLSAHQVMAASHKSAAQTSTSLVGAALDQVSAAEAAYRRGELPIQSVFLARERLAAIETAALDARKKYFLSYSQWIGALGHTSSKQ
jgi:outer membrane protein, heavy metal efflux system